MLYSCCFLAWCEDIGGSFALIILGCNLASFAYQVQHG